MATNGALRFSCVASFEATHFLFCRKGAWGERKKEGELRMSESMGTKEAEEKWGYKQATIRKWCRDGLIPGADQDAKGSPWHIPKDAKCPKPIKKNAIAGQGGK